MKKLSVCVLFGGISPEHEVSLRSAESILNNMDREKYNVFPVGITKEGDWVLYTGTDYSLLPSGQWLKSITFRLPIIDRDMSMPMGNGLDNDSHVETVCLMSRVEGK